ncbi:MAG: exodeoxyribonuclease VII small subunit [Bradymonadaceae bacterium]|nr:exodeoxyribonuclease VII small subunit [Lujinxingiaceae bacterium]
MADKVNQAEPVDEQAGGLKYREAMEELSRILAEIEGDHVDLDELAVKVERAAFLLQMCRKKIQDTEMKVKAVIDGLDPAKEG